MKQKHMFEIILTHAAELYDDRVGGKKSTIPECYGIVCHYRRSWGAQFARQQKAALHSVAARKPSRSQALLRALVHTARVACLTHSAMIDAKPHPNNSRWPICSVKKRGLLMATTSFQTSRHEHKKEGYKFDGFSG